jgi:hypothetical protein
MARKAAAQPEQAAGGRVKKGHVKVTHMFTPEQAQALRDEAYRRAQAKGSRKPDESEIVREAVDLWIARRGGKK